VWGGGGCSSTPQRSLLSVKVSFNSLHLWQSKEILQVRVTGRHPIHLVWMCKECFHVLKHRNKLCPNQSEKVTHLKLKLPLTNQRTLSLTWPANGRWTFQIFGNLRVESRDVLTRHLDTIGAFCHKFSFTEVLCEPPESSVPAAVRNASNKSPASKLLLNC
jgi:hypothetical protein